ncbi:MAG: MarR family transcriptional regulator [Rhodocyclaceae bacterium]|nr:MarR family transcriptional regulator [Rhodocyclaceae bacterium]
MNAAKSDVLKEDGPASNGETPTIHKRDVKLGYLIHDVSRLRRNVFDQLMKPLGVTRSQWWVLAYLSRHDGMMQTRLAELLDIGKASLGSLLDRLESGGWVDRRPDPVDRRAKRVFLTQSSKQLLQRMTAMEQVFNSQILGELSEDERDQLIASLSKVKQKLSQFESNIDPEAE